MNALTIQLIISNIITSSRCIRLIPFLALSWQYYIYPTFDLEHSIVLEVRLVPIEILILDIPFFVSFYTNMKKNSKDSRMLLITTAQLVALILMVYKYASFSQILFVKNLSIPIEFRERLKGELRSLFMALYFLHVIFNCLVQRDLSTSHSDF